MNRLPVFQPEARRELREAADLYALERDGLDSELLDAVEATMHRLIDHPEPAPIAVDPVRKCRVPRFPYAVLS